MNSRLISRLMVSAALGFLLLAGRSEIILIAGPLSLVVGLVTPTPAAYDSVKY